MHFTKLCLSLMMIGSLIESKITVTCYAELPKGIKIPIFDIAVEEDVKTECLVLRNPLGDTQKELSAEDQVKVGIYLVDNQCSFTLQLPKVLSLKTLFKEQKDTDSTKFQTLKVVKTDDLQPLRDDDDVSCESFVSSFSFYFKGKYSKILIEHFKSYNIKLPKAQANKRAEYFELIQALTEIDKKETQEIKQLVDNYTPNQNSWSILTTREYPLAKVKI